MRAKLPNPTKRSESPNASCSNSEPCSDRKLGQTKNTNVIASCGRSRASGTTTPGKVTRLSCIPGISNQISETRSSPPFRLPITDFCPLLHVGPLELPQQFVAAGHRAVERFLGGLLALQRRFHLFLDRVSDLHETAESEPLRVLGRRVQRHLFDGDVGAGILVVIALLPGKVVGRLSDRQVAGLLVPPRLHLRLRQVAEKFRHPLVIFGL